jgi:hypothetical protein
MSTNLSNQRLDARTGDGGAWYQLRSEREQICEALLSLSSATYRLGDMETNGSADAPHLETRLRLIDEALDRLTIGAYGDCVVCGRWIEDTKLHADPAQQFCCACQRRSSTPAPLLSHFTPQLGSISAANRGVHRNS